MKLIKFIFISLLSLSLFTPVLADEAIYEVRDKNSGFSTLFDSYSEALSFFNENLDNYDNLVLLNNSTVIKMEYGIVEFIGTNGIVPYSSTLRKENDYIASNYGIDGAYLYTRDDEVYFKISGDIGYTKSNNVRLIPIEELGVSTSIYETKNGYLFHNIKTQLDYEFFSNCLRLDYKPEYLQDNSLYYSYDGHYFYNDFYLMIDDYVNGVYANSVNDKPYYNYYEYLPHRSISNYSLSELEDYFYNTLCMDGKLIGYNDQNGDGAAEEINRSQLFGEIDEFYNCQCIYGTNEMMLISSALLESSYGKALHSFMQNNLYANAAYETELEKNAERYNNVAGSIYSHSKYFVSSLYSNHLRSNYNGTYFGNKTGGISIEYSLDTYYGEKAASQYFELDVDLGFKDYNNLAIAIINSNDEITFYKDELLSDVLYTLNDVNELSLVVLEEGDTYYKVQIDDSFSDEYLYDFDDSVAYIYKDEIFYLLNENNIHNYEMNKINYDFNGGTYHDYSQISFKTLNGFVDPSIEPVLDGYEFVDYTSVIGENGSIIYKANYKEIAEVSIDYLLEKQGELLPYPDLSLGRLNIKYADGTSKKVHITSDMISSYDSNVFDSQTIYATYCGITQSKDIQIDGDYYLIVDDIKQAIDNSDAVYVKDNLNMIKYPYSMFDIRRLDLILRQENNRNYVINDKTKKYNISVSGLDLSLDDRRNFNLIEDTYYVNIDEINGANKKRLEKIASGYGFDIEAGINVSFRFNYQNIDLRGPAIVQLDLDNKVSNKIYSVYHLDTRGNVIKCRTTQSDSYIQFIINEKGDYLVLSMPSNNEYNIDDTIENLNGDNVGFDNNRTNLEFMLGLILIMSALIGILVYYRIEERNSKQWKDYKKLLQKADTVQEEKQNN